jgi:signal-transduction protein with cAMP-binding, CBS, and nucleotidyltransferase domain
MPVKDIMTHGLITVAPGDDLNRVMRLMTRHRVRHLPVLRYGKLVGVISIGDVGTNHASWRNQLLLEEEKSSLGPLAKRRY